jgi:hypothetical protein
MKKLVSIFVLIGLILSSFFSQENVAYVTNSSVTLQAANSSNLANLHKRLVLFELTSETETSEQDFSNEFDHALSYYLGSEILFTKNVLKFTLLSLDLHKQDVNSLPLFLATRSIRI